MPKAKIKTIIIAFGSINIWTVLHFDILAPWCHYFGCEMTVWLITGILSCIEWKVKRIKPPGRRPLLSGSLDWESGFLL